MKIKYNNQQDNDLINDNSMLNNNDDFNDNDFLGDDLDMFSGGDGMSPMDKHKELLKELTDFDPILKETVNSWLGRIWSTKQNKYVRAPFLEPVMNQKCAAWCIGFIKTYARKTNIITNLDREQLNNMQLDIINVIWLGLATRDDFGIKNSSDLFRICNELEHTAILVLMGAEEGKYNKLLSTTTSRNESVAFNGNNQNQNGMQMYNPQNNKSKPSFWGSLKKGLMGG